MIRLSPDELQKVLRLAASKGVISPTAGPTIGTVADVFGIQPHQVEGLLNEVRERDAEAPQWRMLRNIGIAVAAFTVVGLSFNLWRSSADGSAAGGAPVAQSDTSGEPGLVGGRVQPLRPDFAGASFGGYQGGPTPMNAPTPSPAGVSVQYPTDVGVGESGGGPILPQNRYAKTDASDLESARSKAGVTSVHGSPGGDIRMHAVRGVSSTNAR